MNLKKLSRLFLPIPLILGFAGCLMAGYAPLDALFTAVQMYALEYGDGGVNLLIEIARWTAPLATASSVLMGISFLYRRLHARWLYRRGDGIAVYGPDRDKADMLEQLGARGIDGGEDFIPAHTYFLLGSETENLAFYNTHRDKLEAAHVYLQTDHLPAQASGGERLHLFCPEETAARLFWKAHPLYPLSRERGHHAEVVFVGFGKLGEELLLSALQNNIFSMNQKITYHIFGQDRGFTAVRHGLRRIADPVVFHGEPWYEALELIAGAAMVVVLEQEQQSALLRQLTLATTRREFHVFAADPGSVDILDQHDRLTVFDWMAQGRRADNLLGDSLNTRAKAINLRHANLYSGVAMTEENARAQWEKLDTFTRYSNISSADYHEIQRAMLAAEGIPTAYDAIPEDWRELLSALEHERWCRYHYLHNWQQGVPHNGKSKDPVRRLHTDLIDYGDLSDADKQKDRENIRILFSM